MFKEATEKIVSKLKDIDWVSGFYFSAAAMSGVLWAWGATEHREQVRQDIHDLNTRPTVIFASVASCVDSSYGSPSVCSYSYQRAFSLSQEGNMRFSFYNDCVAKYSTCEADRYMDMQSTGYMTFGVMKTSYSPTMAAWQAVANDLQTVRPLYQLKHGGLVDRSAQLIYRPK